MTAEPRSVDSRRQQRGGVGTDLLHLLQGFIPLSFLWDLVVHVINDVSVLATDSATALPIVGLAAPFAEPTRGIVIWSCEVLPGTFCAGLVTCLVGGLMTYVVLKLVCSMEWVWAEISWNECWEEITWWNPWSWVKSLVCIVKTAFQWILQKICKWIEVIVVGLVVICIIVALIALA